MINRRQFLETTAALIGSSPVCSALAQQNETAEVFFSKEISPQSLIKMFKLVGGNLNGKIAIKLHTGEPHGPNIIPPSWVQKLQEQIPNSTIVECNVLYGSPRQTTKGHRETLKANGWNFSRVDIMDEDGEAELPSNGAKYVKSFRVGKNFLNYDSMLVLTHFKGHTMGGFGGSMKNIAIGCGSSGPEGGKAQLHGLLDHNGRWIRGEELMERMADGAKAITDHFGKKIVYINVLRKMSVDCDCAGTSAAEPTAPDIGILASTDLLAIDQASVDLIKALPEEQKRDLMERITSRKGLCQLSAMKERKIGHDQYKLIDIDKA